MDLWRAGDAAVAHLDKDDVDRVVKIIDEKRAWLDESASKLAATPKTSNPPVLAAQFLTEKTAFDSVVNPILNKPKPKPPKEEKKEEKKEGEKASEGAAEAKDQPQTSSTNGMEVD